MKALFSVSITIFLLGLASFTRGQEPTATEQAAVVQSFKVAPSYFIPNTVSQKTGKRLVADDEVTAFVQTQKGRVMFTPGGAYIGMRVPLDKFERQEPYSLDLHKRKEQELPDVKTRAVVFKVGFSEAQAKKRGIGPRLEEATGGTVNFMVGPKENWRTKVPTYQKLVYEKVWGGIDLEYLGFMDHLEFRLVLEPGSDSDQIVMETGGEGLQILENGQLVVSLAGAELVLSAPNAYQKIHGKTVGIPVHYQIKEGNKLGFKLGRYFREVPLIIDPTLTWSTFLGGPGGDGAERGHAIALDSTGNAYITGYTPAADYPTTTGAYDETFHGSYDVFVSKLSSDGRNLSYSTFLGGTGDDIGYGITVDTSGNAYVTGSTISSEYPTTIGAYNETNNGSYDVFVSKLSSNGSVLSYSTFLGGANDDYGNGIAVDTSGNAYVTGYTNSSDYPTTSGAFDQTYHGSYDVFVSKLGSDGTGLSFSTFLGGTSADYANGIAIDTSGNAYVTGRTSSADYPATSGSFDQTYHGMDDAFVSKLSSDGSALSYSTFLGGMINEVGYGIAVDASSNAYVTGRTSSADYPSTSGAFDQTHHGSADVFVTKLSSDGSALSYSTFLGGYGFDAGSGIAVDTSGNAYVTGSTLSTDYPTTSGTYNQMFNGGSGFNDVFVSKLRSDGSDLTYSTFLGGTSDDHGTGIAVDTGGNAYVTGYTDSSDYPSTSGAFDQTFNGGYDVFVSKLSSDGSGLSYSTFLGGTGVDDGYGIAVDTGGNAYVTGYTDSSGFPTTSGAYDQTYDSGYDVFVSKMNSDGSGLIYSTFLGGMSADVGNGISVDTNGNAYVTGYTLSSDYPTTSSAYDQTLCGDYNYDVFVSKLSSDGSGLSYSTFLGGTSHDVGNGIAVDTSGNAYVTGYTYSNDYPTTSGTCNQTNNGSADVFVSKLSSDGSDLSYSTFLGGSSIDYGYGIALDTSGNAYVTGYTGSTDYPTTSGAYDQTHDGSNDVFVSKLSNDGSSLSYSTFLGGANDDVGYGIAVDESGNAYVAGYTISSGYPTTSGAYEQTYHGSYDGFVSKLSNDGSSLSYSTFLGGSSIDYGYGIALDTNGNAYVTGFTFSSDYPTTSGAYDQTHNGGHDVFVSKLSSDGSGLSYSTFLGGTGLDFGYGIALDTGGNVFVTGSTGSSDYPTTNGAYDETQNGSRDVFVSKIEFCKIPSSPSIVIGYSTVCESQTGLIYSIDPEPEATGYTWNVPSDATITSGQGTTSISVDFGSTSGNVSVTADNSCGSSSAQSLAVITVTSTPNQPGSITGDTSLCANATGVSFSIGTVSGATGYTWTVPSGASIASITSGQEVTSISVDFGSTSGNVTVTADNSCGSSAPQTLAVNLELPPDQPDPISGDVNVCKGDSGVVYSIAAVQGADSYQWTVPDDATIDTGQNSTSISVTFGNLSGEVQVLANGLCGPGPSRLLPVQVYEGVQVQTSFQDVTLCQGTSQSFTINSTGDTLVYQWLFNSVPLTDGGNINGATASTLVIDPLSLNEEGVYSCEVSNPCSLETSNSFTLTVDDQLKTLVTPSAVAQGLAPLNFTVYDQCGAGALSYDWTNLTTGATYIGNPLELPVVHQNTQLELVVTDQNLSTSFNEIQVLWHASDILDLNGDGCNTLDDIYYLTEFWREPKPDDPNGDGIVDIRDFFYINLDSQGPCVSSSNTEP